ncbi:hypothetical protein GPOL_c09080 [Gordonia polyisoprenivorans VH2]|uniref:DUF4166 domain-containing protein n=2 Tax=Gordonia polyisoprenivorans TaxID=84595 RepID=H6MZI4_GORPV|nr:MULTISPECIES: DUF4166 domain-containing protein [Gordonia]AFA71971.1 hypothetical protein GPOL_c09080 [Gordonia polyisoprenivorans VH2]MDF3280763.1 DUF4166 domain-containing protein [Gordonia sp. N1V]NKY00147.1 DUF4166 domain-containing protein [Gordonia polyisoprenivorans]QUD81933.1 DUF4166 domain-containing protein [Gordonia polyisoprenivorans]UZF57267.1 DUF4166 domain-containing protein [Gordonia polyisoprenivorans]
MTPVYRDVLGSDFDRLHPNIAWRYSIDSTSNVAQIGTGILESVYITPALPPPFFWYYGKRNALPSKTSRMVPFSQGHYCYTDELGRENLAVLRSFDYTSGTRKLNSLLVAGRTGLVDYFGDGPELLYPIEPSVTAAGELLLESGPMRWLGRGPKVGMKGLFGAQMKYIEGWDEERQRFRCDATVRNPVIGEILHFRGWFTATDIACSVRDIPDEAWPLNLVDREV